jgi:hypothetical protein
MTVLLAHHLEWHHLPVLLALFGTGLWLGWHLVSRALARRTAPPDSDR